MPITRQPPGRWHVLGAGAIGCLWAAQLAEAGVPANLILRNRKAVKAYPGCINYQTPESASKHIPVPAQYASDSGSFFDRLLISVKAPDTLKAIESVRHRLSPDTLVVLMQNGMGVADRLTEVYPDMKLCLATTTNGVFRSHPFEITHAGRGDTFLGPGQNVNQEQGFALVAELSASGLEVMWDEHISIRLWRKLAVNVVINPLTALLGCKNGELLNLPGAQLEMQALCEETAQAMQAEGLVSDSNELFLMVCSVAAQTAGNYSSTLQDIQHGRKTEIDFLNGYLVRCGAANGITLPRHEQLLRLIFMAERKSIGRTSRP